MGAFETYEHNGVTVEIHYDDHNHDSPRDWDNVGTIAYWHDRYILGDDKVHPDDMTVECPACGGHGTLDGVTTESHDAYGERLAECPKCGGDGEVVDVIAYAKGRGARVVLPVYAYIHSGVTISAGPAEGGNPFSCKWDSGLVGIIYDTPDGVKRCIGDDATDEQIEAALRSEIKVFDQHLLGDVYGYIVDPDGEAESCWGYYGIDHVKESANDVAEYVAKKRAEAERVHRMTMAVWRD